MIINPMDKINVRHIADTKIHAKQTVYPFRIRTRTITNVRTISNNFIILQLFQNNIDHP